METSKLIIYCIFVAINSAVSFFISYIISRWMKRTETKINKLEHLVRSTDEYICYNKHITDMVYLNYLDGYLRVLIKNERYEDAEIIKNLIMVREKIMKGDIQKMEDRRMEELRDKYDADFKKRWGFSPWRDKPQNSDGGFG